MSDPKPGVELPGQEMKAWTCTHEVMTSSDVARRLGVTPATVRLWERLGRLSATRTVSGMRLFAEVDVERMAAARASDKGQGSTRKIVGGRCENCGIPRSQRPAPPVEDEGERGWRDIASAPKDGTPILVWAGGVKLPTFTVPGSGWSVVVWEEGCNGVDINWWCVYDGKGGPYPLRGNSPTHWMPLPAPPEVK